MILLLTYFNDSPVGRRGKRRSESWFFCLLVKIK